MKKNLLFKIVAAVLVISILMCFVSCGSKGDTEDSSYSPSETTESTTVEEKEAVSTTVTDEKEEESTTVTDENDDTDSTQNSVVTPVIGGYSDNNPVPLEWREEIALYYDLKNGFEAGKETNVAKSTEGIVFETSGECWLLGPEVGGFYYYHSLDCNYMHNDHFDLISDHKIFRVEYYSLSDEIISGIYFYDDVYKVRVPAKMNDEYVSYVVLFLVDDNSNVRSARFYATGA